MIELLSLPRRQSVKNVSKTITNRKGLPINSLPGWEQIPLNSKLPMLKCPHNQVIFSKNKIGQTFKQMKLDFDTSARDRIPEYNPLHDSNLQTFYSNERNLKRLRQNGEITANNDVICTLKDFNEYRLQLHRSQVHYIVQELNRIDIEQHDRMLIANAEAITARDHENLNARLHSYNEIIARRDHLQQERANRFKKLLQHTQSKFENVANYMRVQHELIAHRKIINNMRMQQHLEISQDLQRKRLISLKKLFQFKNDRLQKNIRQNAEMRQTQISEQEMTSWQKRLDERIDNQKRIKLLLDNMHRRREIFIKNHREKYSKKWAKIQHDIQQRAYVMKQRNCILKRKTRKHRSKNKHEYKQRRSQSLCHSYEESFDALLDADLCKALHTVLDMEGGNIKLPFNPDDPIYKAAKYILNHILKKFDKDLTNDTELFEKIYKIFDTYFEEIKRVIIYRAIQIIFNIRSQQKISDDIYCKIINSNESIERQHREGKNVAFNYTDNTIGVSSYEIHPHITLKPVSSRVPTPPGSLASMRISDHEDNNELQMKDQLELEKNNETEKNKGAGDTNQISLKNKDGKFQTNLCRNELIFVEHFIIKFKRELIVNTGRAVFTAIQLYFQDKEIDLRMDLLKLERKFLLQEVAHGILSYNINPLNYETALKLSTSVLSTEIIVSLQKYLLRRKEPKSKSKLNMPCKCQCPMQKTGDICLFWDDDTNLAKVKRKVMRN